VDNISTKDLGVGSHSGRYLATLVSEHSNNMLRFGAANSTNPSSTEMTVPENCLRAQRSNTVEISVKVDESAVPYHRTDVRVSLQMTPPNGSSPYVIQHYELPIQITENFHYDPSSKVLLVINSETTSEEVEAWKSLVSGELKLKMDIWNVVLNGHLGLISGDSVFNMYRGKNIILLGNSFEYFDKGKRNIMDLVDQNEFAQASLGGTNFLVSVGLDVESDLGKCIPRFLRPDTYPKTSEFKTCKTLIEGVVKAWNVVGFFQTKFICLPKRRRDDRVRCQKKAARIAKELRRHLPNIRFGISWTSTPNNKRPDTAGEIEVNPCTPYDKSKLLMTHYLTASDDFNHVNGLRVVHTLPFAMRLERLWNQLGVENGDSGGCSS
jgi:hypothetical protein